MTQHRITSLETRDVRFPLEQGVGSDAVHSGAEYAFATTLLRSDEKVFGTGANTLIMLDANQQWTLPRALEMCQKLRDVSPYFVEEPTHPDDIRAHGTLAEAIKPIPIALGEHVPNRIMFKNLIQGGADRTGGLYAGCGNFRVLTVSLLARKFGLRVVPHVGDMGQIHQHLVLFNHIAVGHKAAFLECIPHLQPHFVNPAQIENGVYVTPQVPGSSSDLKGVRPGA
jgi:L-fuconate dehydratase